MFAVEIFPKENLIVQQDDPSFFYYEASCPLPITSAWTSAQVTSLSPLTLLLQSGIMDAIPLIFILGWLCFWIASENYCPFAALSHSHPLFLCSKHLKHVDSYQLPGSVCVASGFNSTHRKEIFSTEIFPLLQTNSVIRNRAIHMLPGMYVLFQNMS